MKKVDIQFGGMSNVPDDGINEAGDMSVLLNLRHKGGELVECKRPSVGEGLTNMKQAVYHSNSGYWLVLSNGQLRVVDEEMTIINTLAGDVESFALMGNVVTVYKQNSVEYAIWRSGAFKYLGEMPECEGLVGISVGTNLFDETEIHEDLVGAENADAMGAAQVGAINKTLNTIYHKKGFVDRAWFRAAYRMFDGTYIKASQITQVSWHSDGKFANLGTPESCPGSDNTTNQLFYINKDLTPYTSVHYFKPTITLNTPSISEWKDIIVGVDIFTTGSLMSFGIKHVIVGDSVIEKYATLNEAEFTEKIVNAEFYRYASYDIRGNKEFEVEDTSPSNLAVQTVLTLPEQAVYTAKEVYGYNFKQHIFDYKKKLFKGYRLPISITARGESDIWSANIDAMYVIIETEDGKKVVKQNSLITGKVFGYFSYPDSRASKIILEYTDGSQKMVELAPHPYRNEAYCVYVRMKQTGNGKVPVIINPESNVTKQTYTVDDKEAAKNILKVSAVDNPFYFPMAQTYKFEGDIIGLASNAEAISQGQFGQYPLFVFTKEGIWAMQTDTSGKGAYLSQSPFSREVCDGAVCPVGGGVVFTTKRGLMAISGGQVTELSKPLDGLVPTGAKYSLIVDNEDWVIKHRDGGNYTREYDGANLFIFDENSTGITPDGLQNGLEVTVRDTAAGQIFTATVRVSKKYIFYSNELTGEIFKRASIENHEKFVPVPIREYINGAKLAYNYLHNEVILSNPDEKYKYSYVYSLDSQTWGMIDTKFDITTNSYPELVVYNKQEGKRYTFDDTTAGGVPVVAITRPFTFGSFDFKRLRQAGLRTTFEGGLNFYLLGSNDGAKFEVITGKEYPSVNGNESTGVRRRDLITAMSRSRQYKYFAIAIAGDMTGSVSFAELLLDEGFANNKLR